MRDLGDLLGLPRSARHDDDDAATAALREQWADVHSGITSVARGIATLNEYAHELAEGMRRKDSQRVPAQLFNIASGTGGERYVFHTLGYRYSRIWWPNVTGITYVVEIGGFASAALTPSVGWSVWNQPEGTVIWLAGGGPQPVVFELLDDVPSS